MFTSFRAFFLFWVGTYDVVHDVPRPHGGVGVRGGEGNWIKYGGGGGVKLTVTKV